MTTHPPLIISSHQHSEQTSSIIQTQPTLLIDLSVSTLIRIDQHFKKPVKGSCRLIFKNLLPIYVSEHNRPASYALYSPQHDSHTIQTWFTRA
ncbi:hypothetical protein PGTUg99_037044 [Puccinia graminis f. sp. tritici]|uniref:Uncharacterized protein n=1 Tax=Puccinia graminis f. sp. tritici TaxID=56615 RepID=A0A5B0QV90_PUCGR|nr:hypothetical protein PGTUg99_037044 [Puccinia graminis f. sp. tritici]